MTDTNQASEELINAFIKKWAGEHCEFETNDKAIERIESDE